MQPIDNESAARAVGLHDDAKTVPTGEALVGQHALDDIERKVEPIGFLRVDIEAHAAILGGQRQ
jgi:hypothetical protein